MKKIITAAVLSTVLAFTAFSEGSSSKKIAYGMGVETDSENRPLGAIQAQAQYGDQGALFIGEPENKRLWLTFDEGYENGCTSRILDILQAKNVKAVFFVTYDYAEKNPDLIRRMIDEGHTVGNHTYSHPSLPECTDSEIYDELSKLHDHIRDNFGYEMYVMRPPKGEFSEKVLAVAKDMGYTTVLWSFAYQDWLTDDQPDEKYAFDKITSKTHNGAVYLLHAVSETNAKILPDVIDYWKNNGYIITPM